MILEKFKKIRINRHLFFAIYLIILFLFSLNLNSRFASRSMFPIGEYIKREVKLVEAFFFSTAEISLFGFLEIFVLISIIFIIFINRNYFIKTYNRISYYLKLSIFSILIYEELSFLTVNKFDFLKSINDQNELNFHNSKIFTSYIFEYVPILGKVGLITTLITLLLFIMGYGSYFRILKNLNFIFLEKKNSIYSNLYWINLFMSNLLITINLIDYYNVPKMNINISTVFSLELVELFIYSLFLLDTIDKLKIAKKYFS